MSDTIPTTNAHIAVLELPNAVKLSGRVQPEGPGKVVLRGVRLVGGQSNSKLSLKLGTGARLQFENLSDDSGPIGDVAVTIAGIEGNDLRLALPDDAGQMASRCQRALNSAPQPAAPRPSRMPAQSRSLLRDFERRSMQELTSRFEHFLEHLANDLFELSVRNSRQGSAPSDLFDTVKSLKLHHGKISSTFLDLIAERFRDLTPARQSAYQWERQEAAPESLDLVDLEEFEDFLAVDRMINLGKNQHQDVLEYLTVRLATAIDADPLKLRLPIHVTELCTSLQESLQDRGLSHNALPRIFDDFVRHFLVELDDFYQPLNQMLADAGLYPGLEEEIRVKGSLLERRAASQTPWRPSRPRQESPQPTPPENRATQGASQHEAMQEVMDHVVDRISASLSPEVLYQSVIDALNFKRESEGTPVADGREGPLAETTNVIDALAGLQRDVDLRHEIGEAGSLREYLAANAERINGLQGTAGLSPDSMNQLDLVDNLFSTIKSQLDVSKQLRPALGELQIPLAKLALLEPRFFLDESHAARGVVDKLSQLAASGNFPNRMLEQRVGDIIDNIVESYDRDSGVFDNALEQIDKLVSQQASAHARNVERVVKTQEGQERLRRSKSQVDAAIRQRLDSPRVPRVLLELIDKGWRDLLVLTHVKEGPDSDSWHEHLRTLDLLVEWLAEQSDEATEDLTMQRGLEAEPFIEMLEQLISSELPTNTEMAAVFEELRDVLAGERTVDTVELGDDAFAEEAGARQFRQRLGKTQRLRRWVDRVEQLRPGTWLTYRDKQGERRRMQLAWVSPEHDRYIFVNDRGQKTADMNSVQLARQLSRGAKPPSPAEKLSLVDQSMYGTLEDVQKSLSFSRNHDQLTKLINRGTFIEQVGRALRHANRKASQHAVLHLNIDKFSLVNDVYDHVTGDQVLTEFAKLLSQLHGSKVSSARLGEDDFGILLVDQPLERALEIAEKIRADIENSSADIEGEMVSFTVSIGVAPILEYSPDVDTVIENAARAMHLAKENGRNRVEQFEESTAAVQRHCAEHTRSRQDLEKALATERFVLRAQPIVQTAVNGAQPPSRHFELLLGMREKDGSTGSPEKFIAAAERHGFMISVDRWVIKEAFRWISRLMDAQKVVPSLSINLSGTSITDDGFMDYLFEQISEFGVGTNRLCFEITETGTITNLIKAADFVRAFRNIGCKFSLDDFGTGLASHNYLRELPVDYVKIDGTFITGIDDNRNDFTMARSINDLAHFLGQETIAESVENDRIIARLEEIGVDYLQGWGIGHPRPLEEITRELSSIDK